MGSKLRVSETMQDALLSIARGDGTCIAPNTWAALVRRDFVTQAYGELTDVGRMVCASYSGVAWLKSPESEKAAEPAPEENDHQAQYLNRRARRDAMRDARKPGRPSRAPRRVVQLPKRARYSYA